MPSDLLNGQEKGSEIFKRKLYSVRNSTTNTNLENEPIHLDNVLSLQNCKEKKRITHKYNFKTKRSHNLAAYVCFKGLQEKP